MPRLGRFGAISARASAAVRDGARFGPQFDRGEESASWRHEYGAHEHPVLGDSEARAARDPIGDRAGLGHGLPTAECPRGVGCGIREPYLLADEHDRREACREHQGDRGQRDGELRRHAAPIPVTRP